MPERWSREAAFVQLFNITGPSLAREIVSILARFSNFVVFPTGHPTLPASNNPCYLYGIYLRYIPLQVVGRAIKRSNILSLKQHSTKTHFQHNLTFLEV